MSSVASITALSSAEIPGSLILIGGAIMVVSSGITAFGNILMKMDALQLTDEPHPKFILARRYVQIAISLYITGGIADIVSLGMVPLSLRACASCLTIPFNALFAKVSLGETMNATQIAGALITVFSCIVAMLFASDQEDPTDPVLRFDSNEDDVLAQLLSSRTGAFTMYTLPVILVCWATIFRYLPGPGSHVTIPTYRTTSERLGVLLAATLAASYQTAWTNLIIKCIAVIAQETFSSLTLWILVLCMLISGVGQMTLMSSIMRLFDAVIVVPPYQIAITVWLLSLIHI